MYINDVEGVPEFLLCAYRAYGTREKMSELNLKDPQQRKRAQAIYDKVVDHFYEHLYEEAHFECVDAMLCLIELRKIYGKEFGNELSLVDIRSCFEYFSNLEITSGLIRTYVLIKPLKNDINYQQAICGYYADGLMKVCNHDDIVTPRAKLSLLRRALCMPNMPRRSLQVLAHLALAQMDAEDKLKGIYV